MCLGASLYFQYVAAYIVGFAIFHYMIRPVLDRIFKKASR